MELNLCFGCMREKTQPGPCPYCGFHQEMYQAAVHQLPLGTILAGKYLVGRVLGEGGFGITYVGWDLNLEMKVAVKEYYPNGFVTRDHGRTNTLTALTGSRGEYFQRGLAKFVDEARRLAKFWRLPGIVAVKDYFQENQTAYIVMEFVEGQTLKEILKNSAQKRLPAEAVFTMMRPVMRSLEEIHKAGLIHRDISPDNLMVSWDGQVKLIDFGAARDFLAEGEKSLSVMLKPGYAPEEQYRSRGNQGPWTDVYGLCATMYRAITGEVPEESLDRMAEDTLKRPSQLGVSLSVSQEETLMKGLAVFQRDRYPSMDELEKALYQETSTGENRGEAGQKTAFYTQAQQTQEGPQSREQKHKTGLNGLKEMGLGRRKKQSPQKENSSEAAYQEVLQAQAVEKWFLLAYAVWALSRVAAACIVEEALIKGGILRDSGYSILCLLVNLCFLGVSAVLLKKSWGLCRQLFWVQSLAELLYIGFCGGLLYALGDNSTWGLVKGFRALQMQISWVWELLPLLGLFLFSRQAKRKGWSFGGTASLSSRRRLLRLTAWLMTLLFPVLYFLYSGIMNGTLNYSIYAQYRLLRMMIFFLVLPGGAILWRLAKGWKSLRLLSGFSLLLVAAGAILEAVCLDSSLYELNYLAFLLILCGPLTEISLRMNKNSA